MRFSRAELEGADLLLVAQADGSYRYSCRRTPAELAAWLRDVADDVERATIDHAAPGGSSAPVELDA